MSSYQKLKEKIEFQQKEIYELQSKLIEVASEPESNDSIKIKNYAFNLRKERLVIEQIMAGYSTNNQPKGIIQ